MGADEATVDMPFTEQIIVARQQNFYHTFWQTVTMGWGLMYTDPVHLLASLRDHEHALASVR